MFTAALFVTVKSLKYPNVHQLMDGQRRYTHTKVHYLETQRRRPERCHNLGELENIMLNQRSHSHKTEQSAHDSIHVKCSEHKSTGAESRPVSGRQGLEWRGGKWQENGCEPSSQGDEDVLKLDSGDTCTTANGPKTTELYPVTGCIYRAWCELYLNKAIFTKCLSLFLLKYSWIMC